MEMYPLAYLFDKVVTPDGRGADGYSSLATAAASDILGDSTTQFDITNPAGSTYRYTYDGTGTDPVITALTVQLYKRININAQNFNAANNELFYITGSGDDYFEVTNASGVAENNVTIGTGVINLCSSFGISLGEYSETADVEFLSGQRWNIFGDARVDMASGKQVIFSGTEIYISCDGILTIAGDGDVGGQILMTQPTSSSFVNAGKCVIRLVPPASFTLAARVTITRLEGDFSSFNILVKDWSGENTSSGQELYMTDLRGTYSYYKIAAENIDYTSPGTAIQTVVKTSSSTAHSFYDVIIDDFGLIGTSAAYGLHNQGDWSAFSVLIRNVLSSAGTETGVYNAGDYNMFDGVSRDNGTNVSIAGVGNNSAGLAS